MLANKKYETEEILRYCQHIFRWDDDANQLIRLVRTTNGVRIGDIAGNKRSDGRVELKIKNRSYLRYRVVFAMTHGRWPKNTVDHIDLDSSNDRINNLREATYDEQQQNRKPMKSKLGLYGVKQHGPCRFESYLKVNGKRHYFGIFPDAHMAHAVAKHWKGILHKFHPASPKAISANQKDGGA